MATSSRDVPLTLSVETIGTDGIKLLTKELVDLAKQGGAATPEFRQLGEAIDRIAEESAAIIAVKDLSNALEKVNDDLVQTRQAATFTAQGFSDVAAKTQAVAAAQIELKGQLDAAKKAVSEKKEALALLKAESTESTKVTTAYRDKVRELEVEIAKSKAPIRELGEAYSKVTAEVKAASAEQRTYQVGLSKQERSEAALEVAVRQKSDALREAKDAAAANAISVNDLGNAEHQLLQSYSQTQEAVRKLAAEHNELSAARKRQAQEDERLTLIQLNNMRELERAAAQEAAHILADYAKMEQAQREAATSAKSAGDAINNALGVVGVRSVKQIQAEIAEVRSSFDLLKTSGTLAGAELNTAFSKSQGEIKKLERELRELNGTLTMSDKLSGALGGSIGRIAVGNVVADAVSTLTQKVFDLGRAFIDAVVQGDQLQRGLKAVYGSVDIAASQLKVLRDVAKDSGISIGAIATDFVRFSASMKSANIPLEQSNLLFAQVTRTASSLGLTAEDVSGTLNALGQMASKGTVSLEELRAQLGDRLPGALGLTAKGMGITEAQLIKLVESGNLATRDFIVPFTEGLKTLQGETDGLLPTWQRFKNLLTQTSQEAGESGGIRAMTIILRVLGGVVGHTVVVFSALWEVLRNVGVAVVALGAVFRGDFSGAIGFFTGEVGKSVNTLLNQEAAVVKFTLGMDEAASATQNVGAAVKLTAEEQGRAAQVSADYAQRTGLSTAAAELASNAHLNLASNIVQYEVKAGEMIRTQEGVTEGLKKSVEAAKEQGKEMVTLAKLTGDSSALRGAETQAAKLEADALDALAASQRAEVELLILQRQHKREVAAASGVEGKALDDITAALDKKLAKAEPELEQMRRAADAARAEATSRQLVSDMLRDNSGKLAEYGKAVDEAREKVDSFKYAERQGIDVSAAKKQATLELSIAIAHHRDAIGDLIAKEQLQATQASAALQLSYAQADASRAHSLNLAAEARANGDVSTAIMYEVSARQQQIQMIRLKIQMDTLQADLDVKTIGLKKLLVTGTEDEKRVKLDLLNVELEMIKVKRVGIAAQGDQIRGIENEIRNLRNGIDVRGSNAGSLASDTSARYENTKAIQVQTAALAEQERAKKLSGQNAVDNNLQFNIRDKLQNGTLSASDLGDVQNVITALKQNQQMDGFARQQGGLSVAGMLDSQKWSSLIPQLEQFATAQTQANEAAAKKSAADTTGQTTSSTSGGYTVNVNLNGSTSAIKTASQSDADTLAQLLKSLGTTAQRAA